MSDPFPAVPPLDAAAQQQARARQDRLTKPTGALGRLEEVSIWLAGTQGCCPPEPPERVRVVLFAGDHGVAAAGVSAYPPEVTAQMVANFVAGGAAVNVLATSVGAVVRVVDLSVTAPLPGMPADVGKWRIRAGSGRIDVADALTRDEAERAVDVGRRLADEEVDAGAQLLIPGDMGIGNTTPAAVLIGLLTGADASSVTGRGTGIDDATLRRKQQVVAAAMQRVATDGGGPADPTGLLAAAAGADIAAMAGFLAQAAVRRTPLLLDGVVSGAAALVAEAMAPGARAWWAAGHRSVEPAHGLALTRLGLVPLLDLELRLGEGTGALLAVHLLRAAADTLAGMATFAEANVSERA
jgi:nicotinate-nucleotide--dimethylbenzimidazole phosphoribosyltransferase